MGNLIHHDGITGTALEWVSGDFNDRAKEFRGRVYDIHGQYLEDRLHTSHGINATNITGSMDYWQTLTNLSTDFSHYNQTLIVVENPSS